MAHRAEGEGRAMVGIAGQHFFHLLDRPLRRSPCSFDVALPVVIREQHAQAVIIRLHHLSGLLQVPGCVVEPALAKV